MLWGTARCQKPDVVRRMASAVAPRQPSGQAKRTGQADGLSGRVNERVPAREPASTGQFARYVCAHELDKT